MITAVNSLSSFNAYNLKSNNQTNKTLSKYNYTNSLKSDTVSFTGTAQKLSTLSDNIVEALKGFIKPLEQNRIYDFNEPTVQRLRVIHVESPAIEEVRIKCISRELSDGEKYMDFAVNMKTNEVIENGKAIKNSKLIENYESDIPILLSAARKHANYPKS